MVTSKQAIKGERMQPNKQRGTKGASTQTTKGIQARIWQRPRSKHTSMDLKDKAWEWANKAQTCKNELIQTLY